MMCLLRTELLRLFLSVLSTRSVVILSLLLPACGEPGPDDDVPEAASAEAPPSTPDSLVIALASDARDFLSVVQSTITDSNIAENLQSPMIEGDFSCKIVFQPGIATAWSFSEDGKTLRVTLRDDITWQDGAPVTPQDLAFTYDLVGDPVVGSTRRTALDRMTPDGRPHIVDATTVEWRFTEAYDRTTMIAHAAGLNVVPKHLLDVPGLDRTALRGHPLDSLTPISSGPWRVETWEKNNRLVLVPNEHFTGPASEKPKLARVVFKVLPEYSTRLLELQNGDIDLMENVQVADADKLALEHPEISLHRRGWRSSEYVAWNGLDPEDYRRKASALPDGQRPNDVAPNRLFGDPEVRRALTMAIDVNAMIRDLLTSSRGEVYGRPAVGTITPALCGVHNDSIQPLPHDPAAAKARLAALGWKDSNADNWIDKDGKPFRFTLLVGSGNVRRAQLATTLQSELQAVGIDMQVETLAPPALNDRLRKRDYDAALAGMSGALFVDPSIIWGENSEFNYSGYRSPTVAALIARGLSEPDEAKSAPIWQELQAVIYADQPYTFLYWMDEIVAVHSRFQDTTVDILGPYRHLNHWWVPEEKVKYRQ